MSEVGTIQRTEKRLRTEAAILHAAQHQFGELGFDKATIRSIAAEAGIDPKLVMTYFGSKDELFMAAVRSSDVEDFGLAEFSDDPEALAEQLLTLLMKKWQEDPSDPMVCLMRSSLTNPRAAELAQIAFAEVAFEPLAKAIGGPEAAERAALFGTMLAGLFLQRFVLGDAMICAMSSEQLIRLIRPAVRALVEVP